MAEKWQKTSSPPPSGVMKPELRFRMNRMTRRRVSLGVGKETTAGRSEARFASRTSARTGVPRGRPRVPIDVSALSRSRSERTKSGSGKGRADSVDQPADPRIVGERGAVARRGREKVDVRTEPARVPPARDAHLAAGAAAAVRAGRPAAVVGTRRIARPRARSGIATAGGRRARAVPASVGRAAAVALGRVGALGAGRTRGSFVTAHVASDEAWRFGGVDTPAAFIHAFLSGMQRETRRRSPVS